MNKTWSKESFLKIFLNLHKKIQQEMVKYIADGHTADEFANKFDNITTFDYNFKTPMKYDNLRLKYQSHDLKLVLRYIHQELVNQFKEQNIPIKDK